jgi:lysyl-tRNA synthetase class 2
MRETADLTRTLMAPWRMLPAEPVFVSYAQAFQRELDLDVFTASMARLRSAATQAGLATSSVAGATRDDLLDFLVATVIGPRLGQGSLCCLHGYPASQAALAQLDPHDARTALRFELYGEGVELANGFVELADAREQSARFAADNAARLWRGQPAVAPDERLIGALERGLPPCAGVAVGFDRVLMLASGASHIDEVLALPFDEA